MAKLPKLSGPDDMANKLGRRIHGTGTSADGQPAQDSPWREFPNGTTPQENGVPTKGRPAPLPEDPRLAAFRKFLNK